MKADTHFARALRLCGLSTYAAADYLAVARNTVQKWERGSAPIPRGVWQEIARLRRAIIRRCAETTPVPKMLIDKTADPASDWDDGPVEHIPRRDGLPRQAHAMAETEVHLARIVACTPPEIRTRETALDDMETMGSRRHT